MSLIVESVYFETLSPKSQKTIYDEHAKETFNKNFSKNINRDNISSSGGNNSLTNSGGIKKQFKEILNSLNQSDTNDQLNKYNSENPIVAILLHIYIDKKSIPNESTLLELISEKCSQVRELRNKRKMNSFIVAFIDIGNSSTLSKSYIKLINEQFPVCSSKLFNSGCSLVTNRIQDVIESLKIVEKTSIYESGSFSCTICSQGGFAINLSQDDLREHIFIYHCNESLDSIEQSIRICPICKIKPHERMGVHLHECHGPKGEITEKQLSLKSIYSFCLVVVRKKSDSTYLLVNEAAGRGYWLPGGKLNVNESLQQCAIRETKEETGIDIELKGILRFEYSPMMNYSRLRVIFYAEPKDENQPTRLIPNYESVGAVYVQTKDLQSLQLRGKEPQIWFNYVERNNPIYPLSLLTMENQMPMV